MKKEIVQSVLNRSKGMCEVCGSKYLVELHHIVYGRGKRKQCENEHSVVALCWHCHRGTRGVHGRDGKDLDLYLKRSLQKKYKKIGYSERQIRDLLGGKIY